MGRVKTADPKNVQANLYKDVLRRFINADIHVAMIGRVIKYDKDHHTCEVQPLPLEQDNDKRAPLVEVDVPSSVWQTDSFIQKLCEKADISGYQPMRVNSVVGIGFWDQDAENWTGTTNFKLESGRMHSIQDPYVQVVLIP
ncbi:hypothetical protein [Secundilactobacillus kimchicus]|uniref:hypothetical protein n=1 Tax=Secundilactobacillus kimchicus TaxID=528209 RepID=UPI0024A89AC7|nr:hypothetical protein [Secundilactobacillus kimchicus]